MEGSGAESLPVTNGSEPGSEGPKSTRILRIQIQNTGIEGPKYQIHMCRI
jgi:hypothetical protein